MRRVPILVIVLSIVLCQVKAFGEELEGLLQMDLHALSELTVVSTSKRRESLVETPSVVAVLTATDLELLGFNTLEEVMEYIQGTSSVNGEGNVFTTSTIMGNTQVNYNTNTLLLVDGHSLVSPYHGSFDFASVPLASVSKIEVIKGSHSVLYGSNAINAVINIITKAKDGVEDSDVGLAAGSESQQRTWFSYIDRKKGYSVYADLVRTGGERLELEDEAGRSVKHNPNKDIGSFIAQYQIGCVDAHAQFYRRIQSNYRTKGFSNRQENLEEGSLFALDCRYPLKNGQSLFASLEYYDWSLTKEFIPVGSSNYEWDYQAHRKKAVLEYDLATNTSAATLGVTHSVSNARRFKENIDAYDIGMGNDETRDFAAYFNGQNQLHQDLRLHYGLRFYQSVFHDSESAQDVAFDNVSKRFSLVQHLNVSHVVKLIYGEAFRVPTYFEKQVSSATVVGNGDLNPEKSRSLSVGYAFSSGKITADAYAYKNVLSDRITRVPTLSDPSIFQNQNVGEASFYGVESSLKYRSDIGLTGFLGLAYVETEDIEHYYPWMVTGAIGYPLSGGRQRLNLSFKYLDEWGEASDYLLVNPSYEYGLSSDWRFRLQVNNVFNQKRELPEIARNKESVPTIPVVSDRSVMGSVRLSF